MKILSLTIKDDLRREVRSVAFKPSGASFVFGDVQDPAASRKTSNSLGKTLLFSLVDSVYGAKGNRETSKKALAGFSISSVIEAKGAKHTVEKTLGTPSKISLDGRAMNLESYKEYLGIDRGISSKFIHLSNRPSVWSDRSTPSWSDYAAILRILGLGRMPDLVKTIYLEQDKLKLSSSQCRQAMEDAESTPNKFEEDRFLNDKAIESLEKEISKTTADAKNLKISKESADVQAEFESLNEKLREKQGEISRLAQQKAKLSSYVEGVASSKMTPADIERIYKEANIELPGLVKKRIEDVDAFFASVVADRRWSIEKRIEEIDADTLRLSGEAKAIGAKLDSCGKVLSTNEAYQTAMEILGKASAELQDAKFKKGQFQSIVSLQSKAETLERSVKANLAALSEEKGRYEGKIDEYRNWVFEKISKVYENKVRGTFVIQIAGERAIKRSRPISMDMTMTRDAGEGISAAKRLIFDYLLFHASSDFEMCVEDSSCFNGIDPRQVDSLALMADEIASSEGKQAFIGLNKYQLLSGETIAKIKGESVLVLSEDDLLLRREF
ncbi:MAG: DUF2326 domain-containing protein [Bacilli bacterium]|jgi:uncharacterized protein YydD (DUF2326 family)|nr:DUF2326 domain-containing protein [Bacilli bacterium]